MVAVLGMVAAQIAVNRAKQSSHLGARADGNSGKARPDILCARTNQDSLARKVSEERGTRGAEIREQEITSAGEDANLSFTKLSRESFTKLRDFAHVIADGALVARRRVRRDKCRDVHSEWRHGPAQHFGRAAVSQNAAQSQARQPRGFRERAHHKQIPIAAQPGTTVVPENSA